MPMKAACRGGRGIVVGVPVISVITLSYYSKYLFDAIDSVLNQSYPQIQYIISDDGTENFDADVIRAYIQKHKKENLVEFVLLHAVQNTGTVQNANRALEVVKGELVFYLSSDDVFVSNKVLDRWAQFMLEKKSMLCTSYRACYSTEYDRVFEILPSPYQVRLLKRQNNQRIFGELSKSNFIFGCCTAISRQCLQQYGFYDETYCLVEDYPYVLTYVRKGGRIDFFNEITVRYRSGGISSSGSFSPAYEADSDKILEKEILPFVSNPQKVKKMYNHWKKRQIQDAAFLKQNSACNGNKIKLLLLYVRYPSRGGEVLKRKITGNRRMKNADC